MPLIACGQFCATNILAANLHACQTLLRKAAAAGAKALFLPEASDYISTSPAETLALCVPAAESVFVRGLQQEARRLGVPVNVGIHEPTTDGRKRRVRNTSIWIDELGEIAERYQKLHVFDVDIEGGPKMVESRTTEPGSEITPPFGTAVGKLGMLICFDLRFPEPALVLRRLGADIIAYPSAFTVPTGQAHWEVLLRARAIETQTYVVAAAQMGRHNAGRTSYGRAMVVDPWGRVLAECGRVEAGDEPREAGDVEPEICVAEVGAEVLERVRREVPLKRRVCVVVPLPRLREGQLLTRPVCSDVYAEV